MKTTSNYKYFDRELSWLNFNYRVLQEAKDESNPLIERLKFLGIFSNNQDEFFRVRVATIRRLIHLNYKSSSGENNYFQSNLDNILKEVKKHQNEFEKIYQDLLEQLKQHNIFKLNEHNLSKKQGKFIRKYFTEKVHTHLFPIMLKNFKGGNTLNDKLIYFAIELLRKDKPEKNAYAIMEIPTFGVSRFLILPNEGDKKYFILLDDIIRYCLDEVFDRFKYQEYNAYTFKFTRDAELDIDNDVSKSFMEIMSYSLEKRKKGVALRFVYDKDMPKDMLEAVLNKLKMSGNDQLVEGARYHNFKDYMNFPDLGSTELRFKTVLSVEHKYIKKGASIIKAIRERDIMLHYPYQSFQYIVDLLREASIDPKVQSIKMTLYRVAYPSNVINALINASRNGKQVVVFLELQARFDEEANIFWSEQLQKNGVNVITSIPGLKVHSKIAIIKRKEKDGVRNYAYIGTGNFHEKTGALYCDDALLTCDPKISLEVDKVFGLFLMSFRQPRFRHLVVSPYSTRNFFIRLLNQEIKNAKLGKDAWCIIKLNSLSDLQMINKLYQASKAGVKIHCIIRGICKLVPGVKGLSENIKVISIVDRYLEHSRVMIFCNDNNERYFISSADWMVRNLDNRIEVTTPIYDKEIQEELKEMLNIQLKDNKKARILDSKMSNSYIKREGNTIQSQIDIYNYLRTVHTNEK